ncbi:MAG: rhodanese-like domain-containing protein [Streptosporangiaceae bacterium]
MPSLPRSPRASLLVPATSPSTPASGYRSQVAASRLAAAGFRDVFDLPGGYRAWEAARLPVAGGPIRIAVARTPQASAPPAASLVEASAVLLPS